jgi:predicted nucleic acid-binding protein
MTLVDTNVLVDILTADPAWLDWSAGHLSQCRRKGTLRINEIGYAELAVRMNSEGDLQHALSRLDVGFERTPTAALFLAGRMFGRYRAAGGTRTSLLPDFFIGAHANVAKLPLLTRDGRRYRTYFPQVELIAPDA